MVLAAWALTRPEQQGSLRAIDPEALASGPGEEEWMGIFFEEQPVGYAVNSQSATVDGGLLLRGRSLFRIVSMGRIQQVVTAGSAVMDAERRVQRFEFFMDSDAVRLSVRGEIRPGELVMDLLQAGEVQTLTLPMEQAPQISLSLDQALADPDMAVGQRFELPYFDPITMAQDVMEVEVTDVELVPGTAEEAYWITTRFNGIESRRLVTPSGHTLREEGGLGLSTVRMTREEAEALLDGAEPPDLIAMSSVRLDNYLPDARSSRLLRARVAGIDPSKVPHEPPLQALQGDVLTVTVPILAEIPSLPRLLEGTLWESRASPLLQSMSGTELPEDPAALAALEPGLLIPSTHREVQEKAWELLTEVPDRKEATRILTDWVFAEVDKRPMLSVPNGLEVLRRMEGDCNEHSALFVSLARAAGIPARLAAGVVYTDRIDGEPAFYYHAWPEVQLGGATPWVPVDPTFGQFPADATHIKLVEGDLDRQVEIIGLMGKLGLEVLETR